MKGLTVAITISLLLTGMLMAVGCEGRANGLSDDTPGDGHISDNMKPDVVIRTELNDEHTYDDTVDHDELRAGTSVTFNATESETHPEYEGELESFEWWIEDEDGDFVKSEEDMEILENVTFDHVMTYTVWLNVTDTSGNYANESIEVNVQRGPTPYLYVLDLHFSKDSIKVGDSVTISVNVINDGDANATDVRTVLRIDGELIDADWTMYKDDEKQDYIGVDEEVRIDIEWEPEDDGEKTVNVNVTDAEEREYPILLWSNELEDTVTIESPGWRDKQNDYIGYLYDYWWLIMLIVIAEFIAIGIGLLWRRKKKQQQPLHQRQGQTSSREESRQKTESHGGNDSRKV